MATAISKAKPGTVRITQAVTVGDRRYAPGVIENCTDSTLLALAEQGVVARFVGARHPHGGAVVEPTDGGNT